MATTLIAASRSGLTGAHVYNLPGVVADGAAIADAIEAVVPGGTEHIRFDPVDLPFPSEIDHDGIEVLGPLPVTSLADGVRDTVDIFQHLLRAGRMDPAEHGLESNATVPRS